MKSNHRLMLVAVALAGALAVGAGTLQRPDLAGVLDPAVTLPIKVRANAADSLPAVDLQGYASAAVMVEVGQSDLATSACLSIVLQDSTPGVAAWNTVDSIRVDSTDNAFGAKNGACSTNYKLTYQGTRRFIRLLQRASGNNADTVTTTGFVIRSGKRSR